MSENTKVRFYLDKSGFFAESAVILLILAVAFRVIGCWGIWHDRINLVMLLLLPCFCCVLLALCIVLFGRKGFFLSFIPVLLGVVFFVYQALGFTNWVQTVLCVLLYLVVAVLYTGTVFSWIHTKWLLPPLFGLPFLYHIVIQDIPALSNTAEPVTFSAGMQEMSILCIMAALFCVGMGLKKRPAPQSAVAPAPAVTPAPAPAPAPAAEPAPAVTPAPAAEPEPETFDEPYTPVLTLEPEAFEPASAEAENPDEDEHD